MCMKSPGERVKSPKLKLRSQCLEAERGVTKMMAPETGLPGMNDAHSGAINFDLKNRAA